MPEPTTTLTLADADGVTLYLGDVGYTSPIETARLAEEEAATQAVRSTVNLWRIWAAERRSLMFGWSSLWVDL